MSTKKHSNYLDTPVKMYGGGSSIFIIDPPESADFNYWVNKKIAGLNKDRPKNATRLTIANVRSIVFCNKNLNQPNEDSFVQEFYSAYIRGRDESLISIHVIYNKGMNMTELPDLSMYQNLTVLFITNTPITELQLDKIPKSIQNLGIGDLQEYRYKKKSLQEKQTEKIRSIFNHGVVVERPNYTKIEYIGDLSEFVNLKKLSITNLYYLKHIGILPPNLIDFAYLNDLNPHMQKLPVLPQSLLYFGCFGKEIVALPKLPDALRELHAYIKKTDHIKGRYNIEFTNYMSGVIFSNVDGDTFADHHKYAMQYENAELNKEINEEVEAYKKKISPIVNLIMTDPDIIAHIMGMEEETVSGIRTNMYKSMGKTIDKTAKMSLKEITSKRDGSNDDEELIFTLRELAKEMINEELYQYMGEENPNEAKQSHEIDADEANEIIERLIPKIIDRHIYNAMLGLYKDARNGDDSIDPTDYLKKLQVLDNDGNKIDVYKRSMHNIKKARENGRDDSGKISVRDYLLYKFTSPELELIAVDESSSSSSSSSSVNSSNNDSSARKTKKRSKISKKKSSSKKKTSKK